MSEDDKKEIDPIFIRRVVKVCLSSIKYGGMENILPPGSYFCLRVLKHF